MLQLLQHAALTCVKSRCGYCKFVHLFIKKLNVIFVCFKTNFVRAEILRPSVSGNIYKRQVHHPNILYMTVYCIYNMHNKLPLN